MFRRASPVLVAPALLALAGASCGEPTDLQANVRAAVRSDRGSGPPRPAREPAPPHAESMRDLLAALEAGHEGDGLPARMEAALRRDDDAVRAAVAFVRRDKATKLIVDALAVAGTPASQAALCGLARDARVPSHVRAEAVASLGLVKLPTAPTMIEVAELIRARDAELASPALFLAGSVARAGRAEHPAQAAAIERIVLGECARARGADDLVDALAALGNLGSAAVLPRLRAAIAAGDPRVRAAAVRALRLVPDPEADRLLAATLRRDRDSTVRAAAVFAAGFRKLEPLSDALNETAQNDPVEFVRAGAATLLARKRQSATRIAATDADGAR